MREERAICFVCREVILPDEPSVGLFYGDAHEHCAPAEDAETAIATGDYDPGEDYPHGAY